MTITSYGSWSTTDPPDQDAEDITYDGETEETNSEGEVRNRKTYHVGSDYAYTFSDYVEGETTGTQYRTEQAWRGSSPERIAGLHRTIHTYGVWGTDPTPSDTPPAPTVRDEESLPPGAYYSGLRCDSFVSVHTDSDGDQCVLAGFAVPSTMAMINTSDSSMGSTQTALLLDSLTAYTGAYSNSMQAAQTFRLQCRHEWKQPIY